MWGTDAEEVSDNHLLTFIQYVHHRFYLCCQGLLFRLLVGKRGVCILQNVQQVEVVLTTGGNGLFHREGLTAFLLCRRHLLLRNPVESGLGVKSLFDLFPDKRGGKCHEAFPFTGIEACCSLHHSDIPFADQVLQSQSAACILLGHFHHIAQVGTCQFIQCLCVPLLDAFCQHTLLFIAQQFLSADLVQVSIQ